MALRRSGRTRNQPVKYYEEFAGPAPKTPPKKTARTRRVTKKPAKKGKKSKTKAGAQIAAELPDSNYWRIADDRLEPGKLPQSDEIAAELKWHGRKSAMDQYGLFPEDVRSLVRDALRQHVTEDHPARVEFEPILASMVCGVSPVPPVVELPKNSGPAAQPNPTTPTHQVQSSPLKQTVTPAVYNIGLKYTTPKTLGKGGQGAIFKATDRQTGQFVALKKYIIAAQDNSGDENSDENDSEESKIASVLQTLPESVALAFYKDQNRRAIREIKWLSQHTHKNIIKYEAISFWAGKFTFIMPLFDGDIWTLRDHVKKAVRDSQPKKFKHLQMQKLSTAYWMLWTQMLDAFSFLEKKSICHLDVKPHNIFFRREISIDPRDIAWKFVLGDFGVAEYAGGLAWSKVGSPGYIAPENREWPYGVNHLYHSSSDVWSLYKTVARVAVPLHFHFGKHKEELSKIENPADFKDFEPHELREEPFGPWFDMIDDDPLTRPTFKQALERTRIPAHDWSEIIPQWYIDENGRGPKKIFYKVDHDDEISRPSDELSPIAIENSDNEGGVESPTAARQARRGAPGA